MIYQKQCVKNFLKNTTFPCCNYFLDPTNSKSIRMFWTIIVTFFTSCIIYIIYHLNEEFHNESVFVSLSPGVPNFNTNFPGVAICNINVLSKKRVENFIYELHETPTFRNHMKSRLQSWFKMLGHQYTFSVSRSQHFRTLQNELQNYFKENYDMTALLKNLTVPCKELISNCEWNREKFDCRELFQTRLTDSGFCCVFNNVRPILKPYLYTTLNESTPTTFKQMYGAGQSYGLSVSVYNNESDYFYTLLESKGVLLKIFSPYDYADQISGTLEQILVTPDTKALISVGTNTLKTVEPNVGRISPKYRRCRYRYEGDSLIGIYSQSDCYLACRTQSILSMCECIPFMEPTDHFSKTGYNVSTCEMIDIPCLNRYQGKWSKYYHSKMSNIPTLTLEVQNSLMCDCLPNCNDVTYKIETNFFQYRNRRVEDKGISHISVYPKRADTDLYTKTVTITWYEAISIVGGLLSFFLGISLLHITEVLILFFKWLFESSVIHFRA